MVKQLKGYLLLFDQIFANYLAQLAHVKDIFSIKKELKQTYFTQLPLDVDGYIELVAFPDEEKDFNKKIRKLNEYIHNLIENKNGQEAFIKRKTRILDHLLHRMLWVRMHGNMWTCVPWCKLL